MDYTDQRATMICLLDDLTEDFFETYRSSVEAWEAYNGICHSLIALLNVLEDGKEYFDDKKAYFEELIDMYIDEDEDDHQCLNCCEAMSHEAFEAGKMCCDKPRFEGEESPPKEETIVRPPKEETIVRPPEDGVYYYRKYQGIEYLTVVVEEDPMIYLFDMDKKSIGAYDPATKIIDTNVRVVFEEDE